MTQPIERYRRMKADIEDAIGRLDDFVSVVDELHADPFIDGPSKPIVAAFDAVMIAKNALKDGLDELLPLAEKIGVENGDRVPVLTSETPA